MSTALKQPEIIVINVANTQYDIVKSVVASDLGWVLDSSDSLNWDICWQDSAVSLETFSSMNINQKINHFPGMTALSRKDSLANNLNLMQKAFPEDYDFFPETWVLPTDYFDLKNRAKFNLLIVKPESSCQGKGIVLAKRLEDIPERCVAQRYISKPFLIDNLKFDLRLYVLVSGCDPLRVFLHHEGLVRFATEEYKDPANNMDNLFMHLTNYAVNKSNKKYQHEPSSDFLGHKRSFMWLMRYLNDQGHNVDKLWKEITGVIIKTIISGTPHIAHMYKIVHPEDPINSMCFEVLGFDILLDSSLKPWLLEVNHTPSFHVDSEVDLTVKRAVILDALTILNATNHTRALLLRTLSSKTQHKRQKSKDPKKSRESLINKWRFSRDVFEQQQTTRFIKIFPDYKQSFVKILEVAHQIWSTKMIPRLSPEVEEEAEVKCVKRKPTLPKLSKTWEKLTKKNIREPMRNEKSFMFRALPLPKNMLTKGGCETRKTSSSVTGTFLIPKTISYQGMPAPEENKSFMKWKILGKLS